MGYKRLNINMPTAYTEGELRQSIARLMGETEFSYTIENKSLDARNKRRIHWQIRVLVSSPAFPDELKNPAPRLEIPRGKHLKKAVVVGSGPAGFFAAFVLQKAGFQTTLVERGTAVGKRTHDIARFESSGVFSSRGNYAFGEGGAGTFSDGKLTSRSKRISAEKRFILESYVRAGGPEEILYLSHPHLGSDKLKIIVKNLREEFTGMGGSYLFETCMQGLKKTNGKVTAIETEKGLMEADYFLVAPGHSAYDTYRLLMRNGVGFHTKNFALGSRMEHPQEIINLAQWGQRSLPGVKAAEYRLTSSGDGKRQVYSFCMCPGGVVVPATPVEGSNIVNGMSRYLRDNRFANAACVATVNLSNLLNKELSAEESLEWMEKLERSFYDFSGSYRAPVCSISDFIDGKLRQAVSETSYPMGVIGAPLWELLPPEVAHAMRLGLKDFIRKIRGFETGNLLGLESKTSAPIQVDREKDGRCAGFDNLYVIGEGSGYAGGIISSAADGVKAAMSICLREA